MHSVSSESSTMVPVARFANREQAEEFCAIATECGVVAGISDFRRFSGGFDGTLGGTDSMQGFSVQVRTADVPVLKSHLEASMEIDPLDPLRTAGRAELQAIADGPLDGNLCEQIIAAGILAALPAEETLKSSPDMAADSHLAYDRRLARWLGVAGLLFTAGYLAVIADGIVFPGHPHSTYYHAVRHVAGFNGTGWLQERGIASNVRPYLLTLVPMATGAALILSWRQLRNGTRRRMFPAGWRITGQVLFWLPLLVMAGSTGLTLLYKATGLGSR